MKGIVSGFVSHLQNIQALCAVADIKNMVLRCVNVQGSAPCTVLRIAHESRSCCFM